MLLHQCSKKKEKKMSKKLEINKKRFPLIFITDSKTNAGGDSEGRTEKWEKRIKGREWRDGKDAKKGLK